MDAFFDPADAIGAEHQINELANWPDQASDPRPARQITRRTPRHRLRHDASPAGVTA